jgi:hypothetical protein
VSRRIDLLLLVNVAISVLWIDSAGKERMGAAYYDSIGAAPDAMLAAERHTPQPRVPEGQTRIQTCGVNPSDVKARAVARGRLASPYVFPCIVPVT